MTHSPGRMESHATGETLLQPRPGGTSAKGRSSTGLPTDLLNQAADRLRIIALLYAGVFFLAGFFPALLFPQDRAMLFSKWTMWAPGVVAIVMALAVVAATRSLRLPVNAVMTIGLLFEVAGSYGIAAAEYLDSMGIDVTHRIQGLSWVAVWTVVFTIVIPATPQKALVTALASVSAVPVVVWGAMQAGTLIFHPTPAQFFFGLIFPNLLVVVMAYVGARVVYALGAEVKRARELGSYRLVERIGAGGMGEVWRAKHRLLARPAAIKLIRASLTSGPGIGSSADVLKRFEREAQAMASLRSPHTVNLFDFGVTDEGAFYYVMELLEGVDTDTLVKRFGPLPAARTVHVLRQVCHSLSEAHARGLVHRDIKPANIFLCRYGEDVDFVKVLDFGLVKALGDVPDGETLPLLTREHAVHGTPAFIAPEQALGRTDLDRRVDIYATGCLAYWLLTGQQVFTADTTIALLMHHMRTPAEPPSARTEVPIPPALDRLVLQCLAKDPAERPQSARDLAARLDECASAGAWTEDAARDWWAKHLPPQV